ncbi:MAG: OPT/YSL family transporter [Candidatus Obscuribacterales bacterium]|nr:OPT/YSL family transporter [Candidatus Obscuribacterales bacterium]
MTNSSPNTTQADDNLQQEDDSQQLDWYRNVYAGDRVPQLTWRAVLMGGLLGSLMSISNLYTSLKLGWAFGVAITACILSFVIWNIVRLIFPKVTAMTILENNCMQSTASAAGYSTGATIGTAFGAYLLITGQHISWQITLAWTLTTAMLGVLVAVPMKRQMINREQLPFPSGIAAAETLKSLYGGTKEAVGQAYALVSALVVGAVIGILSKGDFFWQKAWGLKLPESIPFLLQNRGIQMSALPGFGFEPSALLIGAGMIVGLRVSVSMLLGALILFFGFAPWVVNEHIITGPQKLLTWSLWTGTACMVSSGLTALLVQWRTIARAVNSLKSVANSDNELSRLNNIEVPTKWFMLGLIPVGIALTILEYVAFSISIPLGIISIVLSFFLALVACRATGETDITPIGAMGKISQLAFAALSPANMTTNLMAASVTANTAIASADLLTDLKSGYLLGANPRKQFIAQFIGVFFGTASIVPAWFLMIPNKEALDAFHPPSTYLYKAVAEALSQGICHLPESARLGILVGGILGIVLALTDYYFPKLRNYTPSAMGLGLSWILPFQNCLGFFIGALIAAIWSKYASKSASAYIVPVASGAIAGESLACAFIAITNAASVLAK